MAVKFADLEAALDFVSTSGPHEHEAYLSRETGEVWFASDSGDFDELPADLEDGDYLAIPSARDLGLGRNLAFAFAEEHLPGDVDAVYDIFRRKGAYGRFKDLLDRRGQLQQWYDYEAQAHAAALMRWCEDHGIQVIDGPA